MQSYLEILRHLPATGLAGALVPAVQFALKKRAARQ